MYFKLHKLQLLASLKKKQYKNEETLECELPSLELDVQPLFPPSPQRTERETCPRIASLVAPQFVLPL
jgi:hypothetical protein